MGTASDDGDLIGHAGLVPVHRRFLASVAAGADVPPVARDLAHLDVDPSHPRVHG